jgi:hypothetical protein
MKIVRLLTRVLLFAFAAAQLSLAGKSDRPAEDKAGAQAAFLEAYKVFGHPRCMNCHPVGDAPLQGDDSHPHFYHVKRGRDGNGLLSMRCANCHQSQNGDGEHSPPGAQYPSEKQPAVQQNQPRWHLPAAATPLVFQQRTAAQLCKQLLNKTKNGGQTLDQLIQHVSHDPLVLWGWKPGEGRTTPPLTHDQFVQKLSEWVDKGHACPN